MEVKAYSIRSADVRQTLENDINSVKPDMVIMSNRGLGGLSRVLLGSVSNHLIHHLLVPIVIVPQKAQ